MTLRHKLIILFAFIGVYLGGEIVFVEQMLKSTDPFFIHCLSLSVILAFFIWLIKYFKLDLFDKSKLTFVNFLWMLLFGYGTLFLSGEIISMLPEARYTNQEAIELLATGSSLLPTVLALVFLGPIVEEILFRGILMNVLFGKDSIVGLIISSSIFGMLHSADNLVAFLTYTFLGAAMGLVYWKTKSLEYAILFHVLNNALATIVLLNG